VPKSSEGCESHSWLFTNRFCEEIYSSHKTPSNLPRWSQTLPQSTTREDETRVLRVHNAALYDRFAKVGECIQCEIHVARQDVQNPASHPMDKQRKHTPQNPADVTVPLHNPKYDWHCLSYTTNHPRHQDCQKWRWPKRCIYWSGQFSATTSDLRLSLWGSVRLAKRTFAIILRKVGGNNAEHPRMTLFCKRKSTEKWWTTR
jgi:hypothetical protein